MHYVLTYTQNEILTNSEFMIILKKVCSPVRKTQMLSPAKLYYIHVPSSLIATHAALLHMNAFRTFVHLIVICSKTRVILLNIDYCSDWCLCKNIPQIARDKTGYIYDGLWEGQSQLDKNLELFGGCFMLQDFILE